MTGNTEARRSDVTARLRRAGHLLGGWYPLEGGGWGCRCSRCHQVVHVAPSRTFGLRDGPCVPPGAELDSWRLYNAGAAGMKVTGCYHSALPCIDPWTVVFEGGDYLTLSEDPGHPQGVSTWGAGFQQAEDDEGIFFEDLPERARRYLLAAANPYDTAVRKIFHKPIPTRLDCGYLGRFDCEDTGRLHGWGRGVGEGPCDYPEHCPARRAGNCKFSVGGE